MNTYKVTFRLGNALVDMSTKVKASNINIATRKATSKISTDCKGQKFEIKKVEQI